MCTCEALGPSGAHLVPLVDINQRSHDGSCKILKRRAEQGPRDRIERVAMCIINEGDKKPRPMRSEKQVSEGVKILEMVRSNVESDECTTVDNDVQCEIPPAQVGLLINPTYNVRTEIDIRKTVLHTTTCLEDIRVGLN